MHEYKIATIAFKQSTWLKRRLPARQCRSPPPGPWGPAAPPCLHSCPPSPRPSQAGHAAAPGQPGRQRRGAAPSPPAARAVEVAGMRVMTAPAWGAVAGVRVMTAPALGGSSRHAGHGSASVGVMCSCIMCITRCRSVTCPKVCDPCVMCHVSCIHVLMCHVSCVMYSCVMCHVLMYHVPCINVSCIMSCVMCHVSYINTSCIMCNVSCY